MENQQRQPNQEQPVENNPESAESILPIVPPDIPPEPPVSDNIGNGDEQEPNQNNTDYVEKIYDEIKSFSTYYKETTRSPWNGVTIWTLLISLFALAVSGMVFLQNEKLVDSANISAKASERSASSSEDAVCQQENGNDISLKSFKSTNDANEKSLNAQITSLQETQKQFETINKPFLQILPKTVIFNLDGPNSPQVIFSIANLGNYPIRILGSKVSTGYLSDIPDFNITKKEFPMNTYLVKDQPTELSYKLGGIDPQVKDSIKSKVWKIYCFGSFKFQDLSKVKDNIYRYYFIIEKIDGEYGIHFQYNKNIKL